MTGSRIRVRAQVLGLVAALAMSAALAGGCATPPPAGPAGGTMADAVTTKPAARPPAPLVAGPIEAAAVQAPPAIATVNGKPVAYTAWLNLMKRSHGLSCFQQLLAVELARQAAEAKGIRLAQVQLDEAFRQEMMEVAGPETKELAEAERIVRAVLARRGVGMDEFRLSAYRNAYLRRIVEPQVTAGITDDALKVEFDRIYGPKVQIRHIQLSDSSTVQKVLEALGNGDDFANLARQLSQNIDSAPEGGLLTPFSRLDPTVPAEIREVAFGLEIGKVSGPVRIDGWTQILKMEKRLPAEPVEYEKVADQVRRSLTEQLVRQKTQELLRNMLQSASIQVYDEDLGKQFQSLREAK